MALKYAGSGQRHEGGWRELGTVDPALARKPEGYIAHPDLIAAVNVALALGQPLLLTGEPGTGKTQLAYSVAHELGFDAPLKFETKSTSESRDLFYTFDTVGRFHALRSDSEPQVYRMPVSRDDTPPSSASSSKPRLVAEAAPLSASDPLRFIQYNALGLAIIRANERPAVEKYIPRNFAHAEPRRSVVLIDEIDKAPRDVPNDILSEIETMSFRIPEIDATSVVSADPAWRPVVIITSNSEKALPDAFLRRCVYYHVPFPDPSTLANIVASRVGQRYATNPLIERALSLFNFMRDPALNLRKRPATAELIDWLTFLTKYASDPTASASERAFNDSFRVSLLKTEDDQLRANDLLAAWSRRPPA